MASNEIHEFCSVLNVYLMSRYKYKTPPAYHNIHTVSAGRKLFDLYFRFKVNSCYWRDDTLVIAVIAFNSRRKGNGLNLLEMLSDLPAEFCISKIGIEEANSQSAAFATTFGFKNFSGNNWIIDVVDLRENLNDYPRIRKDKSSTASR